MEMLTSGRFQFQFGKEGVGTGLHEELPFLLGSNVCPRHTIWPPGTLFWGRGPRRGCTHRKVAGQKLPVLLSKLPHQGPQLLVLAMPERQRAQLTQVRKAAVCGRALSGGRASFNSFSHDLSTYRAPGTTDTAARAAQPRGT